MSSHGVGNYGDGLDPLVFLDAGHELDFHDEGSFRAFSGDFYREDDNVVRGVTMAPGTMPEDGLFGDGDFYGFDKGSPTFKDFGGTGFGDGATGFGKGSIDDPMGFDSGLYRPKCLQSPGVPAPDQTQFSQADVPPKRPDDKHFKYEATTIFLNAVGSPSALGNDLIRFLREGVVSSVTKVTTRKYAIKADIFDSSGVMCTAKLRVYKDSENTYAVEFQRRSGNGVAFNSAYRKASAYLAPLYGGRSRTTPEQVRPNIPDINLAEAPTSMWSEAPSMEESDLAPLLDMAQYKLPIQAEVAVALASIAQDDAKAHLFANGAAVGTLRTLLESEHTEVAYPTACALKHLASRSEANREALREYDENIRKVLSGSSCRIVQDELKQVLHLVGDFGDGEDIAPPVPRW